MQMKKYKILMEDDSDLVIDRAKIILASTTINADIKKMIDKLGKLSTGTVMGISSSTSAAFGAEVASTFVKNITAQLNTCISQLQAATEVIDVELKKLDNITKGITDLDNDVGVELPDEAEEPSEPSEDDTQQSETIPDDQPEETIIDDDGNVEDDGETEEATDTDIDDMFGADPALLPQKEQLSPKETTKESVNIILRGALKKLL